MTRLPEATSTAHGSASPSPTSRELGTKVARVEVAVTPHSQSPGCMPTWAHMRRSPRCISIAVGTRIAIYRLP